jgi:diguanylate cyclase (GGDEF)-like protein
MMANLFNRRSGGESGASPELRAAVAYGTVCTGNFVKLVLRPGEEPAKAFQLHIHEIARELSGAAANPKRVAALSTDLAKTVATFAEYQRGSVENLLAKLGQSVAQVLESFGAAAGDATDATNDLRSVREKLTNVNQAKTLDEAKDLLSSGIEALALAIARQAEREAKMATTFAACSENLRSQLIEAEKDGRTDSLTQLANRAGFEFAGAEWLFAAECHGESFSLAILDLDGFKEVNDTFGHAAGDAALVTFAKRLASAVGQAAFLARVGGDEFVVLHPNPAEQLVRMLDRLDKSLAESPVCFEGNALQFRVSYGAVDADGKVKMPQLLDAADKRLYVAKKARARAA